MVDSCDRTVHDSIEIDATPQEIFAVIANPRHHQYFDGSDTVRGSLDAPDRVQLGDRFSMRMHLGIPYRISSTVVEYEANKKLGWRHLGRHIWRYELEPIGDDRTKVTETFDYGPAISPRGLELLRYPERHRKNIATTLARLKRYIESGDAGRNDAR